MDPLLVALGSAGVSTISSLFDKANAEKQKSKAIEAYKKLLIPYFDTKQRADKVGDTLYTKTMSEINRGAYAYAGAVNPQLVNFLAFTKMADTRAEKEIEVEEADRKFNLEILNKIAQIEASPVPEFNPGKVLEAGFEGYMAGKQLEMAESMGQMSQQYIGALSKYIDKLYNASNQPNITNTNTSISKSKLPLFDDPLLNTELFNDDIGFKGMLNFQRYKDFTIPELRPTLNSLWRKNRWVQLFQ